MAETYAPLGVAELWLVDLERKSIEQRVLVEGAWKVTAIRSGSEVLESARFPDLSVVPADVFAPR